MRRATQDPFWDLVATARRLQAPGGCAWDRRQTLASLLPHLIEEAWEVFEDTRARRYRRLPEELGDVLYTTLFLALIGERRGWWRLEGLLRATRAKMIRRHPHVFGTARAHTAREAYEHWVKAKRGEAAAPSRSKALRPLLVASWEALRRNPAAAARWAQQLGAVRRPSGPSARRGPARARS